jgi:hypothetical protein
MNRYLVCAFAISFILFATTIFESPSTFLTYRPKEYDLTYYYIYLGLLHKVKIVIKLHSLKYNTSYNKKLGFMLRW